MIVLLVCYWCPAYYFVFVVLLCGIALAASIAVMYIHNRSSDPASSAMPTWVSLPV